MVSFEKYTERMKEWQTELYYMADSSVEAIEKSPFMNKVQSKDLEVIYMTDPLDEYLVPHLGEIDGKGRLKSIVKEGLKFGDEDEKVSAKREKIYKEKFEALTKQLEKLFGDKRVSKVQVSAHETESPAIMVSSRYGNSANMQRIMKAQTLSNSNPVAMMDTKVMEINPRHPIVIELNQRLTNGDDEFDEATEDLAWILYDATVVHSGYEMDDAATFAQRMHRILKSSLNLSSLDLEPQVEVEMDDEDDEEEEPKKADVEIEPIEIEDETVETLDAKVNDEL